MTGVRIDRVEPLPPYTVWTPVPRNHRVRAGGHPPPPPFCRHPLTSPPRHPRNPHRWTTTRSCAICRTLVTTTAPSSTTCPTTSRPTSSSRTPAPVRPVSSADGGRAHLSTPGVLTAHPWVRHVPCAERLRQRTVELLIDELKLADASLNAAIVQHLGNAAASRTTLDPARTPAPTPAPTPPTYPPAPCLTTPKPCVGVRADRPTGGRGLPQPRPGRSSVTGTSSCSSSRCSWMHRRLRAPTSALCVPSSSAARCSRLSRGCSASPLTPSWPSTLQGRLRTNRDRQWDTKIRRDETGSGLEASLMLLHRKDRPPRLLPDPRYGALATAPSQLRPPNCALLTAPSYCALPAAHTLLRANLSRRLRRRSRRRPLTRPVSRQPSTAWTSKRRDPSIRLLPPPPPAAYTCRSTRAGLAASAPSLRRQATRCWTRTPTCSVGAASSTTASSTVWPPRVRHMLPPTH